MPCGMPADGVVGASNAARAFTWAGSTMVMAASGPISMRRVMLDASLRPLACKKALAAVLETLMLGPDEADPSQPRFDQMFCQAAAS